jgi:TolB-like protein/class 3 adenylate cyclase
MANEAQPRLAVILHADVVGSTTLVRQDERLAHQRIQAAFRDVGSVVERYGGTVNEVRGDALVAEFARASDAVLAALAVQEANRERLAGFEDGVAPVLRMGIALGEVVIADATVTGAGVVLAQRLEQLAVPGETCVSSAVREAVPDRLALRFESMGTREVKGFDEPVSVYGVSIPEGATVPPPQPFASTRQPARGRRGHWLAVGGVAALLITAAVAWIAPWRSAVQPASVERMAHPLPDKPAIAVLPFGNLSSEKQDEFIAKGLTQDLITALSSVPDLFVISRTSSLTFNGNSMTGVEVAKELGVRYILEGSIQRSGDQIRVTAQLTDATRDHLLWGDNFDSSSVNLFKLQDDLVRKILIELQVELSAGEHARMASRGTKNLKAWLAWIQGFDAAFKLRRESVARGRELFETARALDAGWARPLVGLSWTYWHEARMGWADNRDEWIRKGVEFAEQAVTLAPAEAGGYQMLGFLAQLQGDHDRAIKLRETAYELAPGDFFVVYGLASVLYKAGQPKRSLEYFELAQRLSPRFPRTLLGAIAEAQLLAGEFEDAIATSNRMIAQRANLLFPNIILTAAYSALDRFEDARSQAGEVLRLSPSFTVSSWIPTRVYKEPATARWVADLLVQAGLPEVSAPS